MPDDNPWVLHLVSTTHWDREWYMSLERYRWRLVKLVDHLLELLSRRPEFRSFMLDGQFVVLQDYLEVRPERADELRALIGAGRLLIGPWYSQPLETLASGEALVRNLRMGTMESRRFGAVMLVSYIIDEFGHVSQLPQILRGFGIDSAVAWRGIPLDYPVWFTWRSPDGSSVDMVFSNGGYGHATALPQNLNDHIEHLDHTPHQRAGLRKRIQQRLDQAGPHAVTRDLLCLNGIDHSFAQEDLPEVIRLTNDNIDGVRAQHSTLAEYIAALRAAVPKPTVEHTGELLTPGAGILIDVHSFHPDLKQANRRLEGTLEKWVEPFATISWLLGACAYPQAQIYRVWDLLILNQTHDSIACSSADSVYRQVMVRYESGADLAGDIARHSLQTLCNLIAPPARDGQSLGLVLFNPLGWERHDAVAATIDVADALEWDSISLAGDDGAEIPMQVHEIEPTRRVRYNPYRGHPTVSSVRRFHVTFAPGKVPALGYKRLQVKHHRSNADGDSLLQAPGTMENEHLHVSVNPDGIFNLLDKTTGRSFPGLHFFVDEGEAGDGYTHVPPEHDECVSSRGETCEIETVVDTPLVATLRVGLELTLPVALSEERTLRCGDRAACSVSSSLTLRKGARRLEIETVIENRARDHRLRVIFPTSLDTDVASTEMPFDITTRPITEGVRPQHTFVDVTDGEHGLMVANHGLYEYEVLPDEQRSIAITLLRCSDRIDRSTFSSPEHHIPSGQCLGTSTFSYCVIPHAADWKEAFKDAYEFRFPCTAVIRRELEEEALPGFTLPSLPEPLPASRSFLGLEKGALIMTAVKKHDERDTLIVRLHNPTDEEMTDRLHLNIPGFRPVSAFEVDLNEVRLSPLPLDGGDVPLRLRGNGLLTLEILGA